MAEAPKEDRRSPNEVGIAFAADGVDQYIPEDTIGTVHLGNANDRTGKRFFRGTLRLPEIPVEMLGQPLNIILFPFRAGEQVGISIQISRRHHAQYK